MFHGGAAASGGRSLRGGGVRVAVRVAMPHVGVATGQMWRCQVGSAVTGL